MGQTVLPIQYEVEDKPEGMTGLAGLPLYLEFAHVIGLRRLIADHLQARQGGQGWTDDRILLALVLLNLAGGENVEDVRVLEGDYGFCRLLRELEFFGRTGSERRALKRRWRCGKSEDAHSILKEDLAGGKLLSQLFGANAAWWQITILALNVNSAMNRLVLGGAKRRLKGADTSRRG